MPSRKPPPYLDTVSRFICGATLSDLPAQVKDRAHWVIADSVPVIAAGMQQPEMKAFVARHLASAGSGTVWVVGAGRRAAALDAALLNGTAGTWLELDEGNLFAKGHPGIQVVPAAIALAQEKRVSGADLLLAVALGYEVSARISRAAQVRLSIHPHGTYGVIGAAIAAARLKGFDFRQMRELLNVAATMGMATSRQTLLDGATVRNIFTGHSGYMGLTAARLVECGFTGENDGVANVYGKVLSDTFRPGEVTSGLGTDWLITRNYFKLHPTGRYVHAAIDALEDLLAKVPGGRLDVGLIKEIRVRTYMLGAMLAEKNVTSSFGARFSVPFALASVLYHGRSGLASFDEHAVADPNVQALAALVDLREDERHTARYPHEQPCDLAITLADGSVREGHCTVMKGEPANPHRPQELEAKFFDLGIPVWGEDVAKRLFDGLRNLEDMPDFGAFADRLSL
ncbi:MAG: MmgE/PrpD family protein [Betaproteobacteria bacterium]|nr:MmgE/PrpD family protein [Betaproteobacteria bacterium]